MKIRRITIENVTSYSDPTVFVFDDGMNIMIGPNGGGKSNLQKTLALILSTYFIPQYEFRRNDNEVGITRLDLWNRRKLAGILAPHLGREDDHQNITVELSPDRADVENIITIGENLDLFNDRLSYWESPREKYEPYALADDISRAASFTYRVHDLELDEPDHGSAAWGYLEYLRSFFIFMRLGRKIPRIQLTSPVFFFFSERTSTRGVEVQSNQLTESQYYSGFRSAYQAAMGDSTDLMQWGAQHFARVYWKAVNEAAQVENATASALFGQQPVVQQLTSYLRALGYEWNFLTDADSVSYAFVLRKDDEGPWLTADKFSSGEREIVHFLLAMFALNVKDGVILIDEPELHLHPRWQRIFMGLFRDVAPRRNNQFLIATHSPVFVTPETVDHILRIYQKMGGGSTRVALRDVGLPEKKSLVRMINSQNNERVFFADSVVLVEGITDRLALGSLMRAIAARFRNFKAVEIVEVGGKANFRAYQELLDGLDTPWFVIADLDYVLELGGDGVGELFTTDTKRVKRALTHKKSLDAREFERLLRRSVREGDTDQLRAFLEYVEGRCRRLKDPLDEEETELLGRELERLRSERVILFRKGELEDYLPPGVATMEEVVEAVSDPGWVNAVEDEECRIELAEVMGAVLELDAEQRAELKRECKAGTVAFTDPFSRAVEA